MALGFLVIMKQTVRQGIEAVGRQGSWLWPPAAEEPPHVALPGSAGNLAVVAMPECGAHTPHIALKPDPDDDVVATSSDSDHRDGSVWRPETAALFDDNH